jgi:hypothetical protein
MHTILKPSRLGFQLSLSEKAQELFGVVLDSQGDKLTTMYDGAKAKLIAIDTDPSLTPRGKSDARSKVLSGIQSELTAMLNNGHPMLQQELRKAQAALPTLGQPKSDPANWWWYWDQIKANPGSLAVYAAEGNVEIFAIVAACAFPIVAKSKFDEMVATCLKAKFPEAFELLDLVNEARSAYRYNVKILASSLGLALLEDRSKN